MTSVTRFRFVSTVDIFEVDAWGTRGGVDLATEERVRVGVAFVAVRTDGALVVDEEFVEDFPALFAR